MMGAFLLEVGTEELPTGFISSALQQWQHLIPAALQEEYLAGAHLQLFATPRRLAVLLTDLPAEQPDRTESIKGPPVQVAYQNGQLTQAGQGFARKQGVDPDSLQIRETEKGEFVFAIQQIQGRPTPTVLQERVPTWITGLSGERLMRWGAYDLKFPRPIRWVVALWEDTVLPIQIEPLQADRITQGHRVLHPAPIPLSHARDYREVMESGYVQADVDQRCHRIQAHIHKVVESIQGEADIPTDLLEEVTHLVEWPSAVLGTFDPDFLELPGPVIKTVMITHQRYFPVHDRHQPQQLLPYFVTISNGDPAKSELIAAGNSRVIRARLADARFFYQEDLKRPLASRVESLAQVTFVEKLGTVRDRVDRMQMLARWIGEALQVTELEATWIERTAYLCKADLVTQMVYEFPELQGIMGADYARQNQEPAAVVEGITQHYWPLGAGDPLPTTLTGQVVGIADRLDLLVGLFSLGKIPSGSSDPFALRRAANSVVLILWDLPQALDLHQLLQQAVDTFVPEAATTLDTLEDFFLQRLQTLLKDERQIDYDLVNAVLGEGDRLDQVKVLQDIQALARRADYLQAMRISGVLADLYPTLNRTARLAQQGSLPIDVLDPAAVIDLHLLKDPAEADLYQVCCEVFQQSQAAQQQDYDALVQAFRQGAPTVSRFFDEVLVMDPDPAIKANRLNLLGILRNHALTLADFSAVVMAGEG
jgi:glycyl-tRNA synthetase beta chain